MGGFMVWGQFVAQGRIEGLVSYPVSYPVSDLLPTKIVLGLGFIPVSYRLSGGPVSYPVSYRFHTGFIGMKPEPGFIPPEKKIPHMCLKLLKS